jgi:hypothetical protein
MYHAQARTRIRARTRWPLCALAALTVSLASSLPARADLRVEPGWDLLQTVQPTSIDLAAFGGGGPLALEGVPLGTFDFTTGTLGGPLGDFGRGLGVQDVGTTDTIIKRLEPAFLVGPPGPLPRSAKPIHLEMVALQLKTTAPTDLGAGLGDYYFTLQTMRGAAEVATIGAGTASGGRGFLSVTFDNDTPAVANGTFGSALDVHFDVRFGALNGAIIRSGDIPELLGSNLWSHTPPPGAFLLDGANNKLNGVDNGSDFFWSGTERDTNGREMHSVTTAQALSAVPEPGVWGTTGVIGFSLLGLMARARRKAR